MAEGTADGIVTPNVGRLRRLADRVQEAHSWLWEGGTNLDALSHRMEYCDEDHAGCAHVGLVEMARVIAASYDQLQWVNDNIYTIARREHRRLEDGKALRPEMWAHVLRLCEQAGAQSRTVGVLRTVDAVDPHACSTGKPSTRESKD
jgi:hypothetical protein